MAKDRTMMEQEILAALNRVANAMQANADAIVLLARATAGELEEIDLPQVGSLSEAG